MRDIQPARPTPPRQHRAGNAIAREVGAAALAGVEAARSKAEQDNRYLATFVQPGLPQTATRPRRAMIIGLAACFIFIAWLSAVLIALSNRDRTA